MLTMSTKILRANQPRWTSSDPMYQLADNPDFCLRVCQCFNLHGVYDGAFSHPSASDPLALPLSTIAQTSATTTTTTTSTTPAIYRNAPGAASITILTTTIPASIDVESVQTCPHYDRTFITPMGLVRHLRIQRLANQCQEPRTCTHRIHLHCSHRSRTSIHRRGLFTTAEFTAVPTHLAHLTYPPALPSPARPTAHRSGRPSLTAPLPSPPKSILQLATYPAHIVTAHSPQASA
ncbi:hypothetical protein SprV_0401545700 [Sparganum proliferum]